MDVLCVRVAPWQCLTTAVARPFILWNGVHLHAAAERAVHRRSGRGPEVGGVCCQSTNKSCRSVSYPD